MTRMFADWYTRVDPPNLRHSRSMSCPLLESDCPALPSGCIFNTPSATIVVDMERREKDSLANTVQISLPEAALAQVEALAMAAQVSPETLITQLVEEAIKMHRCPGVIFADAPAGRTAVVAGSGIEVWSVIEAWNGGCQHDFHELRRTFDMLTEEQLRAALRYYQLDPLEIDVWIARNAGAGDRLRQNYPQLVKEP